MAKTQRLGDNTAKDDFLFEKTLPGPLQVRMQQVAEMAPAQTVSPAAPAGHDYNAPENQPAALGDGDRLAC